MGLKFTENIYAWILLIRAWSFGHLYLKEDQKNAAVSLGTFLYENIY